MKRMVSGVSGAVPSVPRRAIIYIRISDRKGEDKYGLSTQESSCRAYCATNGYVIVGVHSDVQTGADLFERPGLSAIRAAVRAHQVDVVVCHALDRLSRHQDHRGLIFSEADYAGVAMEFVTEKLEDSPEGRLLLAVRSFQSEVERLKITERTQRGIKARAESGKLLGCTKPLYGYRWRGADKGALDVEPETAAVVRRVFAEALRGASLRGIARALTAEGTATPGGKTIWPASTIYDILGNPAYVGEAFAYRRSLRQGVAPLRLPDGTIPALVDPDTFAAIRSRLAKNKERATRNNRNPEATLLRAGIARCGYCGNALGVANRTNRASPVYRCSNTNADRYGCPHHGIVASVLDAIVWDRIGHLLREPSVLRAKQTQAEGHDPVADVLADLGRRIAGVADRRQRLARAVAALDDDDAAVPLLEELRSLAAEARRLDAERADAEGQRVGWKAAQDRLTSLETWCRRVAGNLPSLTYHEKRRLLDELGVTVYLRRADHAKRWEIVLRPNPRDPDGAIVFDGACAGPSGPAAGSRPRGPRRRGRARSRRRRSAASPPGRAGPGREDPRIVGVDCRFPIIRLSWTDADAKGATNPTQESAASAAD